MIRLTESSTANPSGAPNMSPALQSSGRLALFVQDNCTACIQRVRDLQQQNKEFDLYFVGSQNDAERAALGNPRRRRPEEGSQQADHAQS